MIRYAGVQCAEGEKRKIKYLKASEDCDVPQLSISSFAQNSLSSDIRETDRLRVCLALY